MALSDWSTDANLNGNTPGINWAEGMAPRDVNGSAREMMAQLADKTAFAFQAGIGQDRVSINAKFGVIGNNNPTDKVNVQAALTGMTLGGVITANAVTYKDQSGSWNQTSLFSWDMPPLAVFATHTLAGETYNCLNIDITGTDARNFYIRGGQYVVYDDTATGAGGYGIAVNSQASGGLPVNGLVISNIQALGTKGAILFKGPLTTDSVFNSGVTFSQLVNGVSFDGVSDGCFVTRSLLFGENYGLYLNAYGGALNHTLEGCTIVSQSGALQVANGSRWFANNLQIEQPNNGRHNTGLLGAQVYIQGFDRVSFGGVFTNSSLGGGANTDIGMYVGNSYGVVFDQNMIAPMGATGVGSDILIDTPLCTHFTLGYRNLPRGSARVRYVAGSLLNIGTDVSRLLKIGFTGGRAKCRGIWQHSDDWLTYNGAWVGSNMEIIMLDSGEVRFTGKLITGALTANTLVCTFPDWLCPVQDGIVFVGCANGTVTGMLMKANGELWTIAALPSASIDFMGTSFMAVTLVPFQSLD